MGVQTPRFSLEPSSPRSDADDAAFLATSYGLTPDEWQHTVLRSWMGVRANGRWASTRCGLAVPRQNGKNGVLEIRELFGMVVLGEKFLHTAHEVKTARKAFMRLKSFFTNERRYPELAALVQEIRLTNGQEAIILTNGGSCEFVARSKGSGRGFTVDVLVLDEAQELGDDALEALLPTISAAPLQNPQQIFTGTPPGPKANGEIFTRVRNDGLARTDKRLSWHEWSCESESDLDDLQNLAKSNPGLGIRVMQEVAEAERGTLSDDGYGRERFGIWETTATHQVIDSKSWGLRADSKSRVIERKTLGIDVSPDRSTAAVGLAGQRADGDWHVELDEHRTGVDWIPGWVVARCEGNKIHAVVVDEMSGLVEKRNGRNFLVGTSIIVTLAAAEGRDMAIACSWFFDGIMSAWLWHTDQPQVNVALSVARKRPIGGAWGWNRKDANSDITPVVAETLALWGAKNSTVKKPGRGGRTTQGRRATVL